MSLELATEHTPDPTAPAASADTCVDAAQSQRLRLAVGVLQRLAQAVRQQVLGRDDVIELAIIALIADGHVLLEDFPGSGKTTLAKALGEAIVPSAQDLAEGVNSTIAPFRRIQFTPDLLPSDVTGGAVFDTHSNSFHFRHGPIFAHVVLADEINRTSPKVQVTRSDVLTARAAIDEEVVIARAIKTALVDISRALREDERVLQGNSTRSMVLLLPALQVLAALRGRSFVSAEDIETLLPRVLGHRIELAPGVADLSKVLKDCMREPMEVLARATLRQEP